MNSNKLIGPVLVASLGVCGSSWAATDMTDALPNAKAGQCFAKVLIPARYDNVTENVVTRDASSRIEIIPAKYHTVEEKVETRPASEKIIAVPAVYKDVQEKILVVPEKPVWRKGPGRGANTAPASWVAFALASGVSSAAEVGQCFVEYHQKAVYQDTQEKVLKREASTKIEIIPATYKWEQQKVLVTEPSEKMVNIPATYATTTEKVLERAAYTTWKKGRGPIEKLNNSTGEIMCLVEVPAKYKTITKKVLKTPATTKRISVPGEYKNVKVRKLVTAAQEKRIEVPAEYIHVTKKIKQTDEVIGWRKKGEVGQGKLTGRVICRAKIQPKYKTITKQVIATAATTKKVVIPATTQAVKVRKVLTPAQEKKIEIPAVFSKITKRKKVSDEKLAWRQVLCETNTSKDLVSKLQKALKKEGFDPGPIDGVMGKQTYVAIDGFQKKQGIETGGLTLRTLEALEIPVK